MSKTVILIILGLIYSYKYIMLTLNNKSVKHLLVSFLVASIPFQILQPVYEYVTDTQSGTLGTTLTFSIPAFLIIIYLIVFIKTRYKLKELILNRSFLVIAGLIIISFLNPNNSCRFATFVAVFFCLTHLLLYRMIYSRYKVSDIIKGIYDGLIMLCVLQFFLAICFPVLNIKAATTIFRATGYEGATREGSRVGAVGIFEHPGNLALFTMLASAFILACYLSGYLKRQSLYILVLNIITLILTFSRTSYIVMIIELYGIYYINKNAAKDIFSFWNIVKFLVPIVIILSWLVFFSPFSDLFLAGDSSSQVDNRLVHYLMAYDAFNSSPIIGVGLNAHLEYFSKNFSLFKAMKVDQFFWQNPIHNIHLIILTETGIIGALFWLAFIFRNIYISKNQIEKSHNKVFSLAFIGAIIVYTSYGITGWSPFAEGVLPIFLMISYYAIVYRKSIILKSG